MRTVLLKIAVLFVLAVAGCSGRSRKLETPPNILLLVLDAARVDNFSCYGYNRPTTPNIDRLAQHGLRFTRAVSSSSWTLPAHASLFTGLLSLESGAHGRHAWLVDRIPTLAELLLRKGYHTAGISNNPQVDRAQNLHRGFEKFQAVWADTTVCSEKRPYNTPRTNELLFEFIEQVLAENKPFFAFVNYMDTHMPYGPPEPYRSKFLAPGRVLDERIDSLCRYNELLNSGALVPSKEEIETVRAIYDGALNYLDSEIGKVLDFLEKKGLLQKTLIIVLSDHGEVYGEYGFYTHGVLLNRPLVQIPLIIRHPGLVPEPAVRESLVSITDIFSSLVRLLALEVTLPTGRAVRDLFDPEIADGPCYSRIFTGRADISGNRQHDTRSVWTPDNRQYILCESESCECYDLNRDFAESHNLCPSAVVPQVVANRIMEYESSLSVFLETPKDLAITENIVLDPQRAAALRALGYVGGGVGPVGGESVHPHAQEHLNAGVYFFLKNDFEQAERELRQAIAISSENQTIRTYLGFSLYRQENFREAIRVLRSVLDKTDREYLVRWVLADCYLHEGEKEEARFQFERLLGMDLSPEERARITAQLRGL